MNTPNIRFKGFTGDWKQCKLGKVCETITKGTTPSDKSWVGPVNYIKTESIDKDSGKLSNTCNTSIEEHNGYLKRSQLKKDDVLFSIVGTLGRVGIVEDKDLPANTNQQIAILRLEKGSPYFFLNMLKTPRIEAFIVSDATIGAQPSISLWQLNDLEIIVPTIDEQTKIGQYLSKLDTLITLHQHKCDSLKQVKKYMLQKMFPKQGEKVPEIRFAGFTGDWEQRKVLDVAPLQRGFDLPMAAMKRGNYPVVMSNGIGGYHSEYKAKGPGVITGRSGTIGKLHYVDSDYWPHNTALWVTDFKGNNPKFIYYLYDWLDLSRFGTGSGVPTLNRNDVHDTKVYIPVYEEQQKISAYLDGIDNFITLHQRKSDSLKEIKKFMLQNMFPRK